MAERASKAFAGAELGGWHAPNITSDKISGVGGWSDTEIASYLANGHVFGKGVAAGGMAEAVDNSLRYMTPAANLAIAAYLKATTPIRDPHETRAACCKSRRLRSTAEAVAGVEASILGARGETLNRPQLGWTQAAALGIN